MLDLIDGLYECVIYKELPFLSETVHGLLKKIQFKELIGHS